MENFVLVKFETLDEESKDLIRQAENSTQLAYAPYSKFRVGAALLLDNGAIVTGANQENAAYPDGMCAERVALFAMTSLYPGHHIKKLAVVAKRENDHSLTPVTSCGSCRQAMFEFEVRQHAPFEVIMQVDNDAWVKAVSAESLLPFSFSKKRLNGEGE